MKGAELDEIEALYRSRFHSFAKVATALLADPDAGFDAVQEAFTAAVRKRRGFRGDVPLEAWLWQIVLNKARDQRRSRRALTAPAPQPAANGSGPADAVRESILGLPDRQRAAVFLRYYADLDYLSIARVLDVRAGTVAATLNAAHRTLRKRLQEVPR
jgi:RNA polymerase sigma factor (sigma-70 family)